jgi:hypothetical protein
MTDQMPPDATDKKTFSEEIEVAGNQVIERVQELVKEGNVRRLVIRSADDKVLMEMPLTIAAVGGGAIALATWWLAALGALVAIVARVKIEIVREVSGE